MRKNNYKLQSLSISQTANLNIFEWQFLQDEFLLGVVWDNTAFHFHVCCFCEGMIVDGNQQYAVRLQKEELDKICKVEFVRIHSGLYFHRRQNQPFVKHKSRKRKRNSPDDDN
jgi:hypothetical protein